MKIKEQTRKLAAGCSKQCFENEVSSKHVLRLQMKLTKSAQNMFEVAMKLTKSHCFEVVDETDKVSNHTYGKVTLTWFEEIFEEYKIFR
ncbi:hypothetical protein [Streptococcus pneumoniae]|uniref:hypothetical protein n=1 Tax=Streptococcus pneumoniae TaxID=1313 RepID=UPI00070A0927|nr:hypothetical protein [Streptococcus pneumoniae]